LPFYARECPRGTPCCYLADEYDLEQIKQDMLVGQRPGACQKCWNLEDAGIKSNRQLNNETLDFYFDQDLSSVFESCQQGKNKILHYKIATSNTCNSLCITCSSGSSSAWGQLERRNGITPVNNWTLELDSVVNDINFAQAKSFGFLGGEPLLSATNFKILEQLIEHRNTDCFINFQTNGSIELTQRQKDILAHFTNINMSFSIDGVGPVFEYLRYPLKWNAVLENIDYCRSHGMMVSACYTVSNINLLYHEETCAWFDQNKIRYFVNLVYDPPHFRPGALPERIKKQLPNLEQRSHTEQDDLDYAIFRQKIAEQDRWKSIRMQDYLPKLHDLLG
jgi:sulfatase maturation enzyme AslB (radical SAM superfamily)